MAVVYRVRDDVISQVTWFSLTSRCLSSQVSLYAAASCSYSMSLRSTPGKMSRTRASNRMLSVNVSFERVLILTA